VATITETLSRWASGLRYEDLPPEAIDAAKRFLFDSLGCGLGGFQVHDVRLVLDHIEEVGGKPTCTLIGSGARTDPVHATLGNSLMIRAMDYNDIYWKQDPSHPSDIIPAALSLGERQKRSGRDLIVGIVLGHEIEMRLCLAGIPGIRERGWHHATLTAFAAPVVAAWMLGLDWQKMQHAIGISGSHSCTLGAVTAGKLTMMKNSVDPMAVQNGVEAALLASRGITGPEHVLDGKEGLFHCLGPDWDATQLTEGLGDRFLIVDCGMKAFPTEALTHSPITATLNLVREHDLQAENIETVSIESIARAADILSDPSKYEPDSRETADHSLPYCIAAALADHKVTPQQFTDEKLHEPRLRAQLRKVKVVANEEFEKLFPAKQSTRVTIHTTDGRSFTQRVDVPKGDARDPMSLEELRIKFDALAEPVMSAARREALQHSVFDLENVDTIESLMRQCAADAMRTT
jgi:2-methylcitrate dehydratase